LVPIGNRKDKGSYGYVRMIKRKGVMVMSEEERERLKVGSYGYVRIGKRKVKGRELWLCPTRKEKG
jgi:hypothetical protein